MYKIPQHLNDRLNQAVKFNPGLAQRLEESMGYVADTREPDGPIKHSDYSHIEIDPNNQEPY